MGQKGGQRCDVDEKEWNLARAACAGCCPLLWAIDVLKPFHFFTAFVFFSPRKKCRGQC